jgi:hypothetical protein
MCVQCAYFKGKDYLGMSGIRQNANKNLCLAVAFSGRTFRGFKSLPFRQPRFCPRKH